MSDATRSEDWEMDDKSFALGYHQGATETREVLASRPAITAEDGHAQIMQKYIDDHEDDPRYKHVGGGIALRIDARILADAQLTHTDTADESYGGEP